MNTQFVNRLKSFAWRFGIAIIGFSLVYLTDNIKNLGLPEIATLIGVYVLGEITKWWNLKMRMAGRGFFGKRK